MAEPPTLFVARRPKFLWVNTDKNYLPNIEYLRTYMYSTIVYIYMNEGTNERHVRNEGDDKITFYKGEH